MDINTKMGLIITCSPDAVVVWGVSQGDSITKQRSMFAKDGCFFKEAKFTNDG